MEKLNDIWDYLIESGIATQAELELVTCINGYNEESLNDVIYAKTAYHNIEQLKGDNMKKKIITYKEVNLDAKLKSDCIEFLKDNPIKIY